LRFIAFHCVSLRFRTASRRRALAAPELATSPNLLAITPTEHEERVLAETARELDSDTFAFLLDIRITRLLLPSGAIAGMLQRMKGVNSSVDSAVITMSDVVSYSRAPACTSSDSYYLRTCLLVACPTVLAPTVPGSCRGDLYTH
jgi:hypothetical protein